MSVTTAPNLPALSLVIPTYNRSKLIGETIDSALAQHHPFAEIIIVDDGSTDDTAAVLATYGDRIKVLALANGGVQKARNAGVRAATCPYIVLCDSDDLLLPDFCGTVAAGLAADAACDAVYCNFYPFDHTGDHLDKFAQAPAGWFDGAQRSGDFLHDIPDLYVRTVAYQPLFISGSVIRKSLYEAMGGYDTSFVGLGAEDWEFTLRLIEAGRMALCTAPLVRVRKHSGNSSANSMIQVDGCIKILEFALVHHPVAQQYREAILRSIDERRIEVFDAAFATGAFELAAESLAAMRTRPDNLRFRLKAWITRLPALLRTPLWRATQAA
ncbi:glycosyltransferase family 2 protein [Massilia alkalitolerans]|uniref:glycosyltransferase family 2 protein n=1 Tax=Massilia alkalitolerans TaxID=286638 RepID=UPI0028B145CE|nr:glycosyltransferase [Massilia alkalitolerans]